MNITDIEGMNISIGLTLIKLNILTVGDLLKAVKTKAFEENVTPVIKERIKRMIKQQRGKE